MNSFGALMSSAGFGTSLYYPYNNDISIPKINDEKIYEKRNSKSIRNKKHNRLRISRLTKIKHKRKK